ncbi:hypothetical protein O5286_22655 [Escherichia coli]|nr:hypothetical protein [Escherichia coli]
MLLSILVPVDAGKYRKGGSVPSQNMVGGIVRRLVIVGMNTGRAVACHRKTWWEVSSGGW